LKANARISSFENQPDGAREARERQRADRERDERERHRAPEAAHPVHVLDAGHRPITEPRP
jgi:hypothetical protein